jgi:hypothetical protein
VKQRLRVGLAVVMVAVGSTLDVLVWFHLVAQKEPPLVVHLSTWALIFTGLVGILEVS